MREQIYEDLNKSIANFDALYTKVVPTVKLKYSKSRSQIRSAGHATSKIPSYAATFKQDGPKAFPPVSVRELPNGQFELKDGNTRALAAESAGTDLWISWYHDAQLKPTPDEWEDLQLKFNDHPKSSPNAAQDIKDYLCRQQSSGAMTLKVGFPYSGNEGNYIKQAVGIYRKLLPNAGKEKDWWVRAIESALKGHIGVRYETYTKTQLFEMYKTLYGFSGTKVGEISGGEAVFPFVSLSHTNPNVIGFMASKDMDNPATTYTLVYCVGNMAGKNDAKLKAERKKILDWTQKVSQHYGWSINVYFAPQIKSGANKENMYQLKTTP